MFYILNLSCIVFFFVRPCFASIIKKEVAELASNGFLYLTGLFKYKYIKFRHPV